MTEDDSGDQEVEEKEKTRHGGSRNPWGYYYLRYFVGSVVGAGLLCIIVYTDTSSNRAELGRLLTHLLKTPLGTAAALTALGTAGLAYCYIASAPVLVLHAFRGRLSRASGPWDIFGAAFAALTILVGVLLCLPDQLASSCLRALVWVTFLFVVAVQVACTVWPNVDRLRRFYHKLAGERGRSQANRIVDEYVESYRHLREHGNAFLIILMEIFLAGALVEADSNVRRIGLVLVWILPAAFCWPLGTWLEFKFPPQSSNGTVSGSNSPGATKGEAHPASAPDHTTR